jgi:hypothetical protein
MIALLVILCALSVLTVGLCGFILFRLLDQIEAQRPLNISSPPWPVIPESVRAERVPAVNRKPRKPRPKKEPAEGTPLTSIDTSTLPLPGVSDANKPTL